MTAPDAAEVIAALRRRDGWHWAEALPWLAAIAFFLVLPDYAVLGTTILITILFALSLDLILGYAGIVTLGHAAYFGAGAYATGMLSAHLGWGEPLSGLAFGGAVAGALGLATGWVLLRYHGLTLLMLTLATAILLQQLANTAEPWTGGFDGLVGISIWPLLGMFENDLWGHTYYWYALAVLAFCFLLVRRLVHSPFGRTLVGIRENPLRMQAIGVPVHRRLVTAYALSAALAGIAGALFAQQAAFITLDVLSFARSGMVLIVLVLGGTGRLYGAFIGAAVYVALEDELARISPEFWEFGIGLVLVLVVLFFRGGLLGAADGLRHRLRRAGR
ncbi:MAG: branched-chain amino acid ABC transporter permease [Sneathiellaceae bacterium]